MLFVVMHAPPFRCPSRCFLVNPIAFTRGGVRDGKDQVRYRLNLLGRELDRAAGSCSMLHRRIQAGGCSVRDNALSRGGRMIAAIHDRIATPGDRPRGYPTRAGAASILSNETWTVSHAVSEAKRGFVESLFAQHRRALQAYFRRRLRSKADAADLAQEVYLRMLRLTDPGAIRNPQAYLYTVASNLVTERAILDRRQAASLDLDDASVQQRLGQLSAPDGELEASEMLAHLNSALEQLPHRWRIAIILQYRYGLSYAEIGDRLGVSPNMVKKYLAQAIGRCRHQMAQWE